MTLLRAGVVALAPALALALTLVAGRAAAEATGAEAAPPGASALDAWSALVAAEDRVHRIPGPAASTFTCRVRSSFIDALAAKGGPFDGMDLAFRLWWIRSGDVRVVLENSSPRLAQAEAEQLISFVLPIHDLVLPRPAYRRLSGHGFRFEGPPAPDGAVVVVAEARAADDPRRTALFTIDASGIVVAERSERANGVVTDLHHRHERKGRWILPVSTSGTQGAREMSVTLQWGAIVAGRPVPTLLVVKQFDEVGRALPGGLGDVTFTLSEHAFDVQPPDAMFAE